MALTHTAVTNAKPTDKVYKLFDGGGLYLQVKPTGYKAWKYDYRLSGSRGTYTIGQYPDISLKQARDRHRDAREYVANGDNPKLIKDQARIKQDQDSKRFSYYAEEWIDKQNLAESTYSDLKQRIDKNLTPYLDKKNINMYTTGELYKIMLKMTDRGAKETANRMANVLRRIFNEVLILGVIDTNPAQGLAELLPNPDPKQKSHFGHITSPDEFKELLIQIDNTSSRQSDITTQALKLMPLVFLRPKNIRFLKWEYIDFDEKMITIPASEMKTHKELKVPLSTQAIDILKSLEPLTGKNDYVFVTGHDKDKPLSENTTTQALKRLINPTTEKPYGTGYMTSHGFRHTASTMLNELGFSPDAIELQLAHVSENKIRATYNKSQLMPQRVKMMQAWADYLDELKTSSNNEEELISETE